MNDELELDREKGIVIIGCGSDCEDFRVSSNEITLEDIEKMLIILNQDEKVLVVNNRTHAELMMLAVEAELRPYVPKRNDEDFIAKKMKWKKERWQR